MWLCVEFHNTETHQFVTFPTFILRDDVYVLYWHWWKLKDDRKFSQQLIICLVHLLSYKVNIYSAIWEVTCTHMEISNLVWYKVTTCTWGQKHHEICKFCKFSNFVTTLLYGIIWLLYMRGGWYPYLDIAICQSHY